MKKILAVLLILAILISNLTMLSSCGGDKGLAESSGSPDTNTPNGPEDPAGNSGNLGFRPEPTPEDENGVMVYYEDFDDVTGSDNAAILTALGWKGSINYDRHAGAGQMSADGAGAVLKPYWENTGITTNMSLISIDNGRLKIDNKTNNPNGAYATFILKDAEYMSRALSGNFTVQYNIAYDSKDLSDYMWAGFVLSNGSGTARANINGTYARIYPNGRAEALTQDGHAYKTAANGMLSGKATASEEICKALFGEGATTMAGEDLTVRIVYVKTTETGSDLKPGMYIYVKKAGTVDFTLMSYTRNTEFVGSLAFILGGSYDNDQGNVESIRGDLAWRQNTTNVEKDGEYEAYYTLENDASGVVYIDNVAVWLGTGNQPRDKSTAVYDGSAVGNDPDAPTDEEDENGVMIYYQSFDEITGVDSASILEQLGWKGSANHKYKDSTQIAFGANEFFNKNNGKDESQYCTLMPYFENTGLRTNLSILSIENGALKIDNETNNPNGAWATFEVLPNGALSDVIKNKKSFTFQYDVTYDVTTTKSGADNFNMWAGVIALSGLSDSRPAFGGTYAQVYANGTVRPVYSYAHFINSLASQGGSKKNLTGSALTSSQICEKLFGNGGSSFDGKTVTVRIVYVTDTEWLKVETLNGESVTLGAGMHVYVKEGGQSNFTLVSTTDPMDDRFLRSGMSCGDIVFAVAGDFDNNSVSGTNNSWCYMYAWGHNTTNDAPVVKDGVTYQSYYTEKYDASGIVYLDNFAVWEGTGNIPADKTTSK